MVSWRATTKSDLIAAAPRSGLKPLTASFSETGAPNQQARQRNAWFQKRLGDRVVRLLFPDCAEAVAVFPINWLIDNHYSQVAHPHAHARLRPDSVKCIIPYIGAVPPGTGVLPHVHQHYEPEPRK